MSDEGNPNLTGARADAVGADLPGERTARASPEGLPWASNQDLGTVTVYTKRGSPQDKAENLKRMYRI